MKQNHYHPSPAPEWNKTHYHHLTTPPDLKWRSNLPYLGDASSGVHKPAQITEDWISDFIVKTIMYF